MKYIHFAKNKYSQNGEDGILDKIFEKLSSVLDNEKTCVEFGSWDGIYLSNTFQFAEKGWRSIAIEGSKKRYKDLLKTAKKYQNIHPINKFVNANSSSKNSLNNILKENNIKDNFELLSIDVDGEDLQIWDSFSGKPKVVVIEINSYIEPHISQRHNNINNGSSFMSTLEVGLNKGYTLVCHTGNMIFARNDLIPYLDLDEKDILNPERLFNDQWLKMKEPKNIIKKIYTYLKKKFDV